MSDELRGCVLGILVADGVDGGQVSRLCEGIKARSGRVHLLAPRSRSVQALDGMRLEADAIVGEVSPAYYDALLVVGGSAAVGTLGDSDAVRSLLLGMGAKKRMVGVLGDGRQVLEKAGFFAQGRFGPNGFSVDRGVTGAESAAREHDGASCEDLVVAGQPTDVDGFLSRFAGEVVKMRKRDYVDETSMESFPASDPASQL